MLGSRIWLGMHREPNRGLVSGRPVDTVKTMRWNQEVVTRSHWNVLSWIFEAQSGGALEQYHPFVFALVVPVLVGCGLTLRDDAFDPNRWIGKQGLKGLRCECIGQVLKQIAELDE